MIIDRVINNSMVSVTGKDGLPVLYKGSGIGYAKRPGQLVDESKIEQTFVLATPALERRFDDLLVEISPEVMDACAEVVAMIRSACDCELNDSLFVLLTDHINNLIDRLRAGIVFDNTVLWNLRSLYPDEYRIAQAAVSMLKERVDDSIEDSEANFITLHIVNAENSGDMRETYRFTSYINDIRDIVESNLNVRLLDDDYRVNRLLVHLRYLFKRLDGTVDQDLDLDTGLYETIGTTYPVARKTVEKVSQYIDASTGNELKPEERLYLLVHLVQIFQSRLSDD